MDLQPIMLAIIFILVAASLTYIVMNINEPPVTYEFQPMNISISTTPGSECTQGQEKRCIVSDCLGVKKCSGGYWTECSLDRQCSKGETQPCQYSGCTTGAQECNECGKWGACNPIYPENASCNSQEACNSTEA